MIFIDTNIAIQILNGHDTLDDLIDCIVRWEIAVQTGGEIGPETSLKPLSSVKGALASDAIAVSRQWESTSGIGIPRSHSGSAGNTRIRTQNSRRNLKTFRKRRY